MAHGMYLTEEEAGTKWCPMARQPQSDPTRIQAPEMPTCVASACMMWRTINFRGNANSAPTVRGFCGLAPVPYGAADVEVIVSGGTDNDLFTPLETGDHP